MKKITLLVALFTTFAMVSQVPQKMSYQAVVRDSNNALVTSTAIGMQLSIVQGSATGNAVYVENQSTTTNSNGFIILEIGNGNPVSGNFATINWANGPYFIKTQADLSGGSNYTITGASELLSVPYALYAAQSEIPPGNAVGDIQYWNGNSWVFLPVGTPGSVLKVSSDNVPQWTEVQGAAVAITTNPVNSVTATSVIFDSTITNTDNAFILASGFCLGLTVNPDLGNAIPNISPATVLPNTNYHVRAFVTTVAGTVYGEDVSFTTPSGVASVTTTPVASNDLCNVTTGGTITSDGGEPILSTGICYGKTPNPTVENNYIDFPGETSSFTAQLSGLEPNTHYYYRAVAYNAVGFFYGNELTFTTSNPLTLITSAISAKVCSAKLKAVGTITSSGIAENIGIFYSTTPNVEEYGVGGTLTISQNTVTSEFELTNLLSNTTYYAHSFATICGTIVKGNEISFTTTSPSITVTGTTIEQITMCQARFSFTFTGDESVIAAKKMVYGTSPNPTLQNTVAPNYNNSNPYYAYELLPNTLYHLRACIQTCDGTEIYGPDVTFTTPNKITSISTNPVTEITSGTALLNGTLIGNNIDHSSPGFCYATTPNPTIANSLLPLGYGFADGNPYSKPLLGLTANTTYYVRAYTKIDNGCVQEVIYGNQVSFTTASSSALAIGQSYQGGIIFWLNTTATGGLIAAETDQGTAQWGCMGTSINGTSTDVGNGSTNTSAIIAGCATPGIAARLCDSLVLNGKSDWYLPSEAELLLISQLNYFPVGNYWSSTQANATQANYVNGNVNGSADKTQTDFKVRAIRSF